MLRGLAGGLAGGFLGSMLFSGLGHGATGSGGGGGGIGFLEILLLGVGAFLLFRFIRNRKKNAASQLQQTNYTTPSYSQDPYPPQAPATGSDGRCRNRTYPVHGRPVQSGGFQGLWSRTCFFKIQAAYSNQDLGPLTPFLAPEIKAMFSQDLEGQKARGQVNRLENISVRSVDITEAWQEEGKDYITILFYANLLDYMVDNKTGAVVSGSKTEPVKFREYWTFTSARGWPGHWLLSAIQQES